MDKSMLMQHFIMKCCIVNQTLFMFGLDFKPKEYIWITFLNDKNIQLNNIYILEEVQQDQI